jgi:hypothetical protein
MRGWRGRVVEGASVAEVDGRLSDAREQCTACVRVVDRTSVDQATKRMSVWCGVVVVVRGWARGLRGGFWMELGFGVGDSSSSTSTRLYSSTTSPAVIPSYP